MSKVWSVTVLGVQLSVGDKARILVKEQLAYIGIVDSFEEDSRNGQAIVVIKRSIGLLGLFEEDMEEVEILSHKA